MDTAQVIKPKQFRVEYASIFNDKSVVNAYQYRPSYPAETFSILSSLIDRSAIACRVLDAGCGTGHIARELVSQVDYIDAVDVSEAMIAAGRKLARGDDPRINWIKSAIETAPLHPPYVLIVAAASIHWMDWELTLRRFAEALTRDGYLACVEDITLPNPWDAETRPILSSYSMNKDYSPYDMLSISQALEARGLFHPMGMRTTAPIVFQQSLSDWVESFHARNGFSRDRMSLQDASELDRRLYEVMIKHCPTRDVKQQIAGRVVFGKPRSSHS